MLKLLFFASFLFVSCDVVWSQAPPKAPEIEPKQQPERGLKTQDASPQQPNASTQHPPSIPEVEPNGADGKGQSKTDERSEQGTEFWPPFRGYRLKVTDTLLAGITFLLFLATLALWGSTRKLVRGAGQTAEKQLRAYLLIDGGSIMPITTDKGRIFIKAEIQSKNFGQTPAYHFRSWQRIDIFDTKAIPVYEQGEGIGASDVGPGAGRNVTLSRGPMSAPDMAAIKHGSKTIRIWGRYDYIDVFGRHRKLEFFLKNGKELKSGGWPLEPAEKHHEGN
jgi:hypothetical protein